MREALRLQFPEFLFCIRMELIHFDLQVVELSEEFLSLIVLQKVLRNFFNHQMKILLITRTLLTIGQCMDALS